MLVCDLGCLVYCILAHAGLGLLCFAAFWLPLRWMLTTYCSRHGLEPDPRMWRYLLWLALSVCIAAHVLEDYLWGVF